MRTSMPWCVLLALCTGCADEPAPPAIEWSAVDLQGTPQRLLPDAAAKATALIFVLHECPIANGYAAEINRLHAQYRDRGVRLYVVQADAELTAEQAQRHAREYELQCPVLLDREQRLVRLAGASKTPQAAVVSPAGQVLYLGRIDDRYAGYGQRRAAPTSHDLKNALDAVLAGKDVPTARTEVVGCPIPMKAHAQR